MAIVSSLTAGASAVSGVVSFVKGVFGGGDCGVEKKARTADEISRFLTSSDRLQLVRIANSNIDPTPAAMSEFFHGGKDCKHKNVGAGDQRFLNRLPALISQRKADASRPEPPLPGPVRGVDSTPLIQSSQPATPGPSGGSQPWGMFAVIGAVIFGVLWFAQGRF